LRDKKAQREEEEKGKKGNNTSQTNGKLMENFFYFHKKSSGDCNPSAGFCGSHCRDAQVTSNLKVGKKKKKVMECSRTSSNL